MELLVVGVIVGLLVGLILPALSRAREHARVTACKSNLRQIGQATFVYYDEEGSLPAENYTGYLLWDSSHYVLYGKLLQGNGRRLARVFYCPSAREFGPYDWDTGIQNLGVTNLITAASYWSRSLQQGAPTHLTAESKALLADLFDDSFANHSAGVNVLCTDGAVRFEAVTPAWRVSGLNAWNALDTGTIAALP